MPSLRALARQSIAARLRKLDCFVAFAPRNDDQTHLLLSAPRSLFLIPPPSWGGWHIVSATSDVSGGGVSTSQKKTPTRRFAPPSPRFAEAGYEHTSAIWLHYLREVRRIQSHLKFKG